MILIYKYKNTKGVHVCLYPIDMSIKGASINKLATILKDDETTIDRDNRIAE